MVILVDIHQCGIHESVQEVCQVVCGRHQTLPSIINGMVAPQMGGLVYPTSSVLYSGSVYCGECILCKRRMVKRYQVENQRMERCGINVKKLFLICIHTEHQVF